MKVVKYVLAVIAAIVVGSLVNAGIIFLTNAIFGAPEGMDLTDAASVREHAGKLTIANFVGTLLAHQLGTFVGAFIGARLAPDRKMLFAIIPGVWFFFCGIYACTLIPAPLWFIIADLVLYIPIAIMGGKLGGARRNSIAHNTSQFT